MISHVGILTILLGTMAPAYAIPAQVSTLGINPSSSAAGQAMWIGDDGPNTFTFTHRARPTSPIVLVLWPSRDANLATTRPMIQVSMSHGQKVTVSVAGDVSGAWSAFYDGKTTLTPEGVVLNTWGEFTTGDRASVAINRSVNMQGNRMSAKVSTGCLTDMKTCVFRCENGASSCSGGTLTNCKGKKNSNSGGCGGWDKKGHIDVSLL